MLHGRIPKISLEIEKNILQKLHNHHRLFEYEKADGNAIYYRTSGGRYFKVVTNYPTGSSKEKAIILKPEMTNAIGCIVSIN